jgi:sigma-E factor negative regulatory protein RseB
MSAPASAPAGPGWPHGFRLARIYRAVFAVSLSWVSATGLAQVAATVRTDAQWLQLIQAAGQKSNFIGTVVMQQGGEVRASRIVHVFENGVSHERVQALDGTPREFLRIGNEVRCLWPAARQIVVEWRPAQDGFPAFTDAAPTEVLSRYVLRLEGVERVAGHECQVIVLSPRDALRYGHRLCVDRATGLLLSAQMFNERNDVLEQMAFTDIRIGEKIDRSLLNPSWPTQGWTVKRTEHKPVDVSAKGWFMAVPDGFRRVREVLRKMIPGAEGERRAMQSVYSDGLATFSVFIEPEAAAPQAAASEDLQAHGATHALSRRVGNAMITVVGEVPSVTVRQVAQSVEFRAPR